LPVKWISKTAASSNGASDPSHFPAKAEIVIASFELVCVCDQDETQTQREPDYHHPEKRGARAYPPALKTHACALDLS
jgi:hypothetical protein